ncbi:MAG: hypothetical protein ACFFCQ_10290 [Promethearchaeota archaeon]
MTGIFDKLRKKAKDGYQSPPTLEPYATLGFQDDPFAHKKPAEETIVEIPDLEPAVERVAGHLSDLRNKKPFFWTEDAYKGHHLLLVGPSGSGRTFLCHLLQQVLGSLEDPEIPPIKTFYVNAEHEWRPSTSPSSEEGIEPYSNFQNWLGENEDDVREADILFCDNAGIVWKMWDHIISELFKTTYRPLIVSSLSFSEHTWLETSSDSLQEAREFLECFYPIPHFLRPFSKTDLVVDFLKKRIAHTHPTPNNEPFEQVALEEIAKLALGLPSLACWLGSEAILEANKAKRINVTLEDVEIAAVRLNFQRAWNILFEEAPKAGPQENILRRALYYAGEARLSLGSHSMRDYAQLGFGVTNSDLKNDPIIGKSASTISYHLKDLSENHQLLRVVQRGKSRIYYCDRPVLNALELMLTRQPAVEAELEPEVESER